MLASGRWRLDVSRSTARFVVGSLGRKVNGSVPITDGTVDVDPAGRVTAINGTLHLGAIDTRNSKRDKDLRKPGLLDLDRNPTMTFVADTVAVGDGQWQVAGRLSARGTSVAISGSVAVSADEPDATLVASARLDRRDLGIRAPAFMIGRAVDVTVTARLLRDR
jgi:polyisoprenoid-binding protein YceI